MRVDGSGGGEITGVGSPPDTCPAVVGCVLDEPFYGIVDVGALIDLRRGGILPVGQGIVGTYVYEFTLARISPPDTLVGEDVPAGGEISQITPDVFIIYCARFGFAVSPEKET